MSILSQINRIKANVQSALALCAAAGVAVADGANSDDLPAAVEALANAAPVLVDKTTGTHYELAVDNGRLMIVETAARAKAVTLSDQTTGTSYAVIVDDGTLALEE